MTFARPYIQQLISRMNEPRGFIQVLMGSRQVGKSTLSGQVLAKINAPHLFVSADAVANAGEVWLEQQWETARLSFRQESLFRSLTAYQLECTQLASYPSQLLNPQIEIQENFEWPNFRGSLQNQLCQNFTQSP